MRAGYIHDLSSLRDNFFKGLAKPVVSRNFRRAVPGRTRISVRVFL